MRTESDFRGFNFKFDETIGHIVNRAAIILRKKLTAVLNENGYEITPEEFALLCILWEEDGLFQSEITEKTLKDKTRVARITGSLIQKSLIKKVPYEADRRNYHIYLTEEGRALRGGVIPLLLDLMALASGNISEVDMKTTKATLTKLFHNINGSNSARDRELRQSL